MDHAYKEETVIRKIPTEFTVKYYVDYDCDISYMGHYSNSWESGAIDRQLAGDSGYREFRYWIPTPGCSTWDNYLVETRKWYTEHGYNKHDSAMAAYIHRAQDYRRSEELNNGTWNFIGIVVESAWGTESLWGIEGDSDKSYFEEVVNDLISQLISQESITVRIR